MNSAREKELTCLVREKAMELGFDLCGIARVRKLDEREPFLIKWVETGMHGGMAFLERDMAKRLNPSILLPGAKSVIVTGLNYFNEMKQGLNGVPVISRYAYGFDYHNIILKKLGQILENIKISHPTVNGKAFVDSSPILEKAWAVEAGLGWQGRHSLLINRKIGSFFFIGVLLIDTDLEYDEKFTGDHCAECSMCVEACPVNAINDNRTIDARKCISYHTIENKGPVPEDLSGKFEGRVFGCDKCQEVCPWNSTAKIHTVPEFSISPELEKMTREEWMSITQDDFNRIFMNSPVKRIKYSGMLRNIEIAFKRGFPPH